MALSEQVMESLGPLESGALMNEEYHWVLVGFFVCVVGGEDASFEG